MARSIPKWPSYNQTSLPRAGSRARNQRVLADRGLWLVASLRGELGQSFEHARLSEPMCGSVRHRLVQTVRATQAELRRAFGQYTEQTKNILTVLEVL